MNTLFRSLALLSALCALTACGGSSSSRSNDAVAARSTDSRADALARGALPAGSPDGQIIQACQPNARREGGGSYRVEIPSRVDGEAIVFQVFEPDTFDCAAKHPLILEGHGYSGSRQTSKMGGQSPLSFGAPIAQLTADGFAVISIDQRGHGESGGTIRVMDPAFEGQDLVAILDWAEQHLDYLAYRNGNLLAGGIGGSYGGGYQMLLWEIDPSARLDAIVPEITWNDLTYSLNPGQVVKSYWALFLAGAGDALTQAGQDPFVRATLAEGVATGTFPLAARDQFFARSPAYFCGQNPIYQGPNGQPLDLTGLSASADGYTLGPLLGSLPPTAGEFSIVRPPLKRFQPIDALLFQGMRDNLFNLNEAVHNYQCLQRGGGDVRLLSYETGHGLLTPDVGLVSQALAIRDFPAARNCGPVDATTATLAWFNEKLKGQGNASDVIASGKRICLSLTKQDAIAVDDITKGGERFPVNLGGLPVPVTLGQLVPTIVPLTSASNEPLVVAGIPRLSVTVGRGVDALNDLCQPAMEPILRLGSCDSTVFVGLGLITASASGKIPVLPELIENQVMPLRGFGVHEVDLVGVAERLQPGDQLVLLIYGNSPVFAATSSRDLTTAIVTVSGHVDVPLLGNVPALTGNIPSGLPFP